MPQTLFFIKKYWKIITILVLLSGALSTGYILYKDNLQLESDKAIAEVGFQECQAISANLSDRLIALTEDLQELERQRDVLQGQVTESRITINNLQNDRDRIILELEREREIPEDCEGKFLWLVQEFERIEQAFYKLEDARNE